jgi:hypothetical protein
MNNQRLKWEGERNCMLSENKWEGGWKSTWKERQEWGLLLSHEMGVESGRKST